MRITTLCHQRDVSVVREKLQKLLIQRGYLVWRKGRYVYSDAIHHHPNMQQMEDMLAWIRYLTTLHTIST